MSLLRKKNVNFVRDVSGHSQLKKTLGAWDLLLMGIGAVVGTGIFVLTGIQAATAAGPAVTLSFAMAGVTCIFVALAYTEVASTLPSSGGSYTYAYVSLGEILAWVVGMLTVLQFCCGATTVAAGWSGYIVGILEQADITLPYHLVHNPFEGGMIDLPASLLCLVITFVLVKGVEESTTLNNILVIVKLLAIFVFVAVAVPHFKMENISNFMPFGFSGVTAAAGAIFMAYTGFDAVANAAEESKNPEKDVTFGLIGSLLVCILLYVMVAGALTGIVDYKLLNNSEPLAFALKINGSNIGGALVAAGGIAGMTTVILFQIYAQTRIFMAMSRDGLLPKSFSKIHPKFKTPYIATVAIGVTMSIVSGFIPIRIMGNLASMGTLSVFLFVVISAVRLRMLKPNLKRPFKCPGLYFISALAIIFCSYLIYGLLESVGYIYLTWVAFTITLYFVYSKWRADKVYAKNH
ncbi:MAG: amino acid permease [Rickettsiales bacterium]